MKPTVADLKKILNDTSVSDGDLGAFIDDADVFIQSVLGTSSLGESVITLITKWFAAHMIASTRERMAEEEEAGGARIKYTGTFAEGLHSTSYGQMVLSLDSTGKMAALASKRAKLRAL